MRAAVFEGEGKLVLKDVKKPVIERADQIIGEIEVLQPLKRETDLW